MVFVDGEFSDEQERLDSLRRMLEIGSPSAGDYVRSVRLARALLSVPIAYVSIIDEHCQCLAAVVGTTDKETPHEHSLCLRAVTAGNVVVCHDTRLDPAYSNNPVVNQPPYIRSFAAYPIRSAEGHFIGALCAADTVPRAWTDNELGGLADLAFGLEAIIALRFLSSSHAQALARVESLHKAAHIDALTQLLNRQGITDMAHHAYTRCRLEGRPFAIALLDLDNFKRINDSYGHEAGDAALVTAAQRLRMALRSADFVGRWGGEEFLVLIPSAEQEELAVIGQRLVEAVHGEVQHGSHRFLVTTSVGVAGTPACQPRFELNALVRRADSALYAAKAAGRNCSVVSIPPMESGFNRMAQHL